MSAEARRAAGFPSGSAREVFAGRPAVELRELASALRTEHCQLAARHEDLRRLAVI